MDKYEYRIRAEEINSLIEQQEYTQAVKIADTIDWRRVRSSAMLCKISELYKMNRRYEDSKEVLLLAYDQHPQSPIYRKIIYSLCELSIKLEEIVQAVEYYKEFVQVAPKDTGRFILQYRLYEAQDVSLEERIAVLEEYKKRDYREKWAYELAYLYHRIGLATRCIEECDEMILWFGEGKYVLKAMELKMLHAPLTLQQQEKYNARFLSEMEAIAAVEEESLTQQEVSPSMPIEIKSVEVTKAKTARIPSKEIQQETEIQEEEQEQTREIPSFETSEDVQAVDSTLEELVALVDEIGDSDLEEEIPSEDMPEEELENTAQEASDEEDADMKIVPSRDDLDIQIKTIDVDNQYSTINLQEALAKDLAKLFAEEDMGQADATRALPVDTLEIASKLMDRQEEKSEEEKEDAFGEGSGEEEMTPDENVEDRNEMTSDDVTEDEKPADEDFEEEKEDASDDITEEEKATDESIEEEKEMLSDEELPQALYTEPEGDVDDLTILLPPMDLTLGQLSDSSKQDGEEENASEEEIEVFFEEEPEEVTGETVKEFTEEDKQEETEESGEEFTEESEQEETEEICEEFTEESEQEETEEICEELTGESQQKETEETGEELTGESEQEEVTEESGEETSQEEESDDSDQPAEDISVPEIKEAVEEEKTIAPPIYEGTGVQMSEEMLEQFRQMTIEAAKQAAMVAAAQAAKEAAAQAAKEAAAQAAEQTASAIQANVPDMLLQQEQPAQQEHPIVEAISEQVAENREMPAISQTVEEEEEDKQITGQLSFADIMSGWEKTKKDNEEKHIEEMKQKLLDQTGPIFPQTNTAMNVQNELSMISPMLDVFSETEDLANEVEKALEEETELSNALGTSDSSQAPIPSEAIEEIETTDTTNTTDITDTSDNSEIPDASDASDTSDAPKEVEAASDAQNASAHTEDESQPANSISSVFDTAEINGLEEKLIGSLSNQHYETANIQIEALSEEMAAAQEQEKAAAEELQEKPDDAQDKAEAEGEKAEASSEENHAEGMNLQEAADVPLGAQEESETEKEAPKGEETAQEARTLTKEEKELFGFLAQTKQLQQNLAMALDAISMVPHTGNVMVMAEEGVGALDIAKLIPEYLAKTKDGFTGKTGVFSFEELKSKDIINMVNEYANGAIIIDRAGELSQQAIVTFTNAMRSLTDKGLVVILVDTPAGIGKCKAVFARLSEIFTVEMNINSLDIDGLVKYGKEYARQLDYSIDAMGVLALYNRIEEKQTIDHAVTIDEVKEIVNGAIEKAEKKSLSGFMDIVFGKRYDKESMVLLKEKDFLVDNK